MKLLLFSAGFDFPLYFFFLNKLFMNFTHEDLVTFVSVAAFTAHTSSRQQETAAK